MLKRGSSPIIPKREASPIIPIILLTNYAVVTFLSLLFIVSVVERMPVTIAVNDTGDLEK